MNTERLEIQLVRRFKRLEADYERLKIDYKNLMETCRYTDKQLAACRAVLEECRPMVKARIMDWPDEDSSKILTRIEAALKP